MFTTPGQRVTGNQKDLKEKTKEDISSKQNTKGLRVNTHTNTFILNEIDA